MGLLDDAIREHLELKRRRGADEDEVSRQETEALGAPQQNAEFAEAPAPAEPAPAEHVAAEPVVADAEPPPRSPSRSSRRRRTRRPRSRSISPRWSTSCPRPDPEPELEPAAEPQPPAEGEDVLEETPDFLQETPEHERLWFEQKPPRDFDLDR